MKTENKNNIFFSQTKQTMIFLGLSISTWSTMVAVQKKRTYLDCQYKIKRLKLRYLEQGGSCNYLQSDKGVCYTELVIFPRS